MALLNPLQTRNRIITFSPKFESFENLPIMLTGQPAISIDSVGDTFLPDLSQLEALLSNPQTCDTIATIIVNSPNNPTGTVYPESWLREFARIVGQHPEIAILSDEVYRTVIYDDSFRGPQNYLSLSKLLPSQTLVIGGISKEVSGTGLRLGWVCGPESIIRAIENLHGNATSCVNLPLQMGFADFLEQGEIENFSERMNAREELRKRRDALIQAFSTLEPLNKCKGWEKESAPQGAFYFFPDVRYFLSGTEIRTDEELAVYLLNKAGVVTLPGTKFGRPGFLRLAYARDLSTIQEGLLRMNEALSKIVLDS